MRPARCVSLNSMVLAARSISESARIAGSRSLMAATVGSIAFISRSFLVPNTLARTASIMKLWSREGPTIPIVILLC